MDGTNIRFLRQQPTDPDDIAEMSLVSTKTGGSAKVHSIVKAKRLQKLLTLDLHDADNAERIKLFYGEKVLWCEAQQRWLIWNGKYWKPDNDLRILRIAERVMRRFLKAAATPKGSTEILKFARRSCNRHQIDEALRMLKPKVAVSPDQLDQHPFFSNNLTCTIDLATGQHLPHNPKHYLTQMCHVAYKPYEPTDTPVWNAFLTRIRGGGAPGEVVSEERRTAVLADVDYLQLAFGYGLTGSAREKCFFLLLGAGDNGKSTLVSTIQDIHADYAVKINPQSLMRDPKGGQSLSSRSDLADLQGKRIAFTSETEPGMKFSSKTMKEVVQGVGRFKAERKHQNPFECNETHTIFIDCNNKPEIAGGDKALYSRLRVIQFDAVISEDEKDPDLPQKLLAEKPGIYSWCVQGSMRYCLEGKLPKIAAMDEFSRADAAQSDTLREFINSKWIIDLDNKKHYATVKEFLAKYNDQCVTSKERLDRGELIDRMSKYPEKWIAQEKKGPNVYVFYGLHERATSSADLSYADAE